MITPRLFILTLLVHTIIVSAYYLPVNSSDRRSTSTMSLTSIGKFGLLRKARPGVPAHHHTGIDIQRPKDNYADEPIFSILDGVVISVRRDGPYAQLIIEHGTTNKFWTVYEHIAGIRVTLNEAVGPDVAIARFMNKNELDQHGWQFDHFHFEVLKIRPVPLKQATANPERRFTSFSLTCFTQDELTRHFHNPIDFLNEQLHNGD